MTDSQSPTPEFVHLQTELESSKDVVAAFTKFGPVQSRRIRNGCAVFLEVDYALPPKRFADPVPLPESFQYPRNHEFIRETRYPFQPEHDTTAMGIPVKARMGLGSPSEHPIFLNIFCPPSVAFASSPTDEIIPSPLSLKPVKIHIHGGFLQFGSPHGLPMHHQYVSHDRDEVWVNIGYRLSVFGFLAAENPPIPGNFGFKDQWLAIKWIQDNISSFGGDPSNMELSGLSAGSHSVHQVLHHISRLPSGESSPVQGIRMESNAILIDPKTPRELQTQFDALVGALSLDPTSPDILETIQDRSKVSAGALLEAIASIPEYGTFRGCTDGSWMKEGAMGWQASGAFGRSLKEKGIKYVVVGETKDEWFSYQFTEPVNSRDDVRNNLKRILQPEIVDRLLASYRPVSPDSTIVDARKLYGQIMADYQVHIPVRVLHRDLIRSGMPVLRYEIEWVPEQIRPHGYVTHGLDRVIWVLLNVMTAEQRAVAIEWLDVIDRETEAMKLHTDSGVQDAKRVLKLRADKTIGWEDDVKSDSLIRISENLDRS
ncbi:carboxylesterase [Sistotremastrum niveocremeum HHB9708]|uniref:Carboxylic ester hydrolase n=1 Tax=Sistotremastrum niveocremeum HHB9708 TaxID=1314777 RepID=A0A164Y4L9_9AGAM|nr:carboxylesterase [Sistotremastrum niveocremeum HHB9708]